MTENVQFFGIGAIRNLGYRNAKGCSTKMFPQIIGFGILFPFPTNPRHTRGERCGITIREYVWEHITGKRTSVKTKIPTIQRRSIACACIGKLHYAIFQSKWLVWNLQKRNTKKRRTLEIRRDNACDRRNESGSSCRLGSSHWKVVELCSTHQRPFVRRCLRMTHISPIACPFLPNSECILQRFR